MTSYIPSSFESAVVFIHVTCVTADSWFALNCRFIQGATQRVNGTKSTRTSSERPTPGTTYLDPTLVRTKLILFWCTLYLHRQLLEQCCVYYRLPYCNKKTKNKTCLSCFVLFEPKVQINARNSEITIYNKFKFINERSKTKADVAANSRNRKTRGNTKTRMNRA